MIEQPGEYVEVNGQRLFIPTNPPPEIEWRRVSGVEADYRGNLTATWRAAVPGEGAAGARPPYCGRGA